MFSSVFKSDQKGLIRESTKRCRAGWTIIRHWCSGTNRSVGILLSFETRNADDPQPPSVLYPNENYYLKLNGRNRRVIRDYYERSDRRFGKL